VAGDTSNRRLHQLGVQEQMGVFPIAGFEYHFRRVFIGHYALSLAYLANLIAPPPPSASAVAWSAQALWLVVAWGYWIDRHRAGRLS
jgi:hypothetical protein